MSRLNEDIAFLDHAMRIAHEATAPSDARVSVPAATLATLAEEMHRRRLAPVEYRVIDDQAVWLMQAAHRVVLERSDCNTEGAERWSLLTGFLMRDVGLDLENARKSAEAI